MKKFLPSKRIIVILIMTCLFLSFTGCTGFRARHMAIDSRIDKLIDSNHYDKALEIISEIPPDHEKYDELTQRGLAIKKIRQEQINDFLSEARACENDQDWSGAVAIIDKALNRFPGEPVLDMMREKYERFRNERIRKSRSSIQLARARYLADIREDEEMLLQATAGDRFAHRRYQKYQREVKQLSDELHGIGKAALDADNVQSAIEALSLSVRLYPNEKSQSLLSGIHLEQRDESGTDKQNVAREDTDPAISDIEKQWFKLEASFNLALQMNDLISARQLFMEMVGLDPEEAESHKEILNRRIDRKTKTLQARGRLLYGQGFIREALDVWQEALLLKPDYPELLQNIHRATTFLDNLDRWKDKM